jgi:hypothetical protein
MDIVQNCDSYTDIPWSQTCKSVEYNLRVLHRRHVFRCWLIEVLRTKF